MNVYQLADHLSFGPFELHDFADVVRFVNAILAFACVWFMLVGKGSVWRARAETRGRALAAAVAFMYAVQGYAQLELILNDPVGINDHDADNADGIRPYLLFLALAMTLTALVIRWHRARNLPQEARDDKAEANKQEGE